MFGSKYTSAIYIQLLLQLTPFVVTLVSYFLLKERIPIFALVCLFFSVIGGVLVILSGSPKKTDHYVFHWLIDWNNLAHTFTISDLIGIGMGFGAVVSLATFVVSVKYSTSISKYPVHEFSMLGFGTCFSGIACLILSVIFQENWMTLFMLNPKEIVHFILFMIVTLFALVFDMFAIPIIGASWAASVLAVRLLSTVVFSWPILNEQMDNFWQFFGCALVCIGVSVFLVYKAWREKKSHKNHEEEKLNENESGNLEERVLKAEEGEKIPMDQLSQEQIQTDEITPLEEQKQSSIEENVEESNPGLDHIQMIV